MPCRFRLRLQRAFFDDAHRFAADRAGVRRGIDREDVGEQRRRQHFCRAAFGDELPRFQHDEVVAVARRLVEVVQDGDDGRPFFLLGAHHVHQRDLVVEVEVGGRLIQQQVRRFLRQGHGEEGALLLAAGEFVHALVGKRVGVGRRHDARDDVQIGLAEPSPEVEVGASAVADEGAHADAFRHHVVLRQEREAARKAARAHAVDGFAVEGDVAALRRQQAGEGFQQGRFAAAVRPDECGDFAFRQGGGDAVQDFVVAVAVVQVVDVQCH